MDNADEIVYLKSDRSLYPSDFTAIGFENRQVVPIITSGHVTEYRAEVVMDSTGQKRTADFPLGVRRPVQYGSEVKREAVYLSTYPFIPYERIANHFNDLLDIPIALGSLYHFNQDAYTLLKDFEELAIEQITSSPVVHADETGIHIHKKRGWVHTASTNQWMLLKVHEKRGLEAMNANGVLADYKGTPIHNHCKVSPIRQHTCTMQCPSFVCVDVCP